MANAALRLYLLVQCTDSGSTPPPILTITEAGSIKMRAILPNQTTNITGGDIKPVWTP